ncbi:transposase [Chroococcidiopsis sp. CCMEE 29]|uniref:RNA-guided endonuclease InsQ/TnpB family protein n=1 Tax=Chroococcidiopsis sp. CCMEE 29 TaxID=155894 RepID=UPI0031F9B2A9
MRIAYQYRLRPTKSQSAQMETWLNLLRMQYNYRLAERFRWWDENRCPINACPLVCSIAPLADQPEYYGQKRDLVQTKTKFPEYIDIYSDVLQDCIGRVKKTFDRFLKADSSGKRSGRPRFKQRSRYRSFTYPRMKAGCIRDKHITLPKIGEVKLIQHRPIPEGFTIKTCTVVHKADGWYVTLSLCDDTVPTISPDVNQEKAVGIDLGLKDFLVTSDNETVPIPQFARSSERRRKVLNKALSRKRKKGTKRRQIAGKRLSKHYQKVARQRKDFHYKVANWLVRKYDIIAHEDLNIKGLAKTRLSKSILDAGWGEFIDLVRLKAESAGRLTVAVNPSGTTQNCSGCGINVPKTLADRWHSCSCGLELDRDLNAAINIKNLSECVAGVPPVVATRVAVGHWVNKAHRLLCSSRIG